MGDRVFGAHHLGWDGTDAWRELGYAQPPAVSMNDGEAQALGEWLLRQHQLGSPASLLYVGIGLVDVRHAPGVVNDHGLGGADLSGCRGC
jgi:hypothetical protein